MDVWTWKDKEGTVGKTVGQTSRPVKQCRDRTGNRMEVSVDIHMEELEGKGRTDERTDGRMDGYIERRELEGSTTGAGGIFP